MMYNSADKLTWLIPAVLLLSFIDYSRDYWPATAKRPALLLWAGIALEMLLIICIGYFDTSDIVILYFFVFISSNVIRYPFAYSIPLAAVFVLSGFLIYAGRNGFRDLVASAVSMLFSYGISTMFVMGMSYLVKQQINEREKLAHINTELELAYKKLMENSAAARQLTVEQERTRMAREIHDTLAHTLTNLIVQLEACKMLASLDPSRLPAELEKAQELSRSGFSDIKRSIAALRPLTMEDKSLIASIDSLISETYENTKVNINFRNSLGHDAKLASQAEVALFRAVQESVTNAIRHGQADKIDITLERDRDAIRLSVEDNGAGCANIKKGYGLKGMRERIEGLEGSVGFSSEHGRGFRTEISIPCEVTEK